MPGSNLATSMLSERRLYSCKHYRRLIPRGIVGSTLQMSVEHHRYIIYICKNRLSHWFRTEGGRAAEKNRYDIKVVANVGNAAHTHCRQALYSLTADFPAPICGTAIRHRFCRLDGNSEFRLKTQGIYRHCQLSFATDRHLGRSMEVLTGRLPLHQHYEQSSSKVPTTGNATD